MMSLDVETLEKLDGFQKQGDLGRARYYQTLQAAKDPYGKLALGVVQQNQIAGMAAYSYAKEVAKRYCHPLDQKGWIELSVDLMRRDFRARGNPDSFQKGSSSLKWFVIRNYHGGAFHDTAHLPPIAWTAWIPLHLADETKDEALWHRMLTEPFQNVAIETVSLALSRWAQKAGVSKELWTSVVPKLKTAPPVVTGAPPRDDGFDRCMKRLAFEQMTPNERLAAFYLDCLAASSNIVGTPNASGGFLGPGWGPTVGDVGRWGTYLPF